MPKITSMISYRFVTPAFTGGAARGTTADGKPWDLSDMPAANARAYAEHMDNLALAWAVEHEMHRDTDVIGTPTMHKSPSYARCGCEVQARLAAEITRTVERTVLIRVWHVGDPETTPWGGA